MKTIKPENYYDIPKKLQEIPNWVLWKLVKKPNQPKPTKIPIQINGVNASSTNPDHWSTYDSVLEIFQNNPEIYSGIGFVFNKKCGHTFIDLDNAIFKSGAIKQWASTFLTECSGFAEFSQSGKGLHLIVPGSKKNGSCKCKIITPDGEPAGAIEIYDNSRFCALTGLTVPSKEELCTPEEGQILINHVENAILKLQELRRKSSQSSPNSLKPVLKDDQMSPRMTDDEIIKKATESSNQAKFNGLRNADPEILKQIQGSASEHIYSLICLIAFWTQDIHQIERIVKSSKLFKENKKWSGGKWNRPTRNGKSTLGHDTCRKAIRDSSARYLVTQFSPDSKGRWEANTPNDPEDNDSKNLRKKQLKYEKPTPEQLEEIHRELIHFVLGDLKRDAFSGFLYHRLKKPNSFGCYWQVIDKPEEAKVKVECVKRGKPYSKTFCMELLESLSRSPEIEEGLLIEPVEWDGEDRISYMASMLTLTDERITTELLSSFFKAWFANMINRALDPANHQNICIVLQGAQGVGKDYFVDSLFWYMRQYIGGLAGRGKYTTEADIGQCVSSKMVIWISEFDSISDIPEGLRKRAITDHSWYFRAPFAKRPDTRLSRASFIAACNPDKILTDGTGNRRYAIFQLDGGKGKAIKWGYPIRDTEYSSQIYAQACVLAKQKYKCDDTIWKFIEENREKHVAISEDDIILEDFDGEIATFIKDETTLGTGQRLFPASEKRVKELIQELARNYQGKGVNHIKAVLRARGRYYKNLSGRYYGTAKDIKNAVDVLAEYKKKQDELKQSRGQSNVQLSDGMIDLSEDTQDIPIQF